VAHPSPWRAPPLIVLCVSIDTLSSVGGLIWLRRGCLWFTYVPLLMLTYKGSDSTSIVSHIGGNWIVLCSLAIFMSSMIRVRCHLSSLNWVSLLVVFMVPSKLITIPPLGFVVFLLLNPSRLILSHTTLVLDLCWDSIGFFFRLLCWVSYGISKSDLVRRY